MNKSIKPLLLAFSIASILSMPVIAADTDKLIGLDLDANKTLVDKVMAGRNYMVQVNEHGKISRVVDSGENGSGADSIFTSSQGQVNGAGLNGNLAVSSITPNSSPLPVNYDGYHAVDFLGADLPKVASSYGFTADKFKEILITDSSARIDGNKQLFYIEEAAVPVNTKTKAAAPVSPAAAPIINPNPQIPIASVANATNAFKLHSKPGSTKTIYLDFVGYTATNTVWSSGTLNAPAFDLGGNPSVFDNNELNIIAATWNRVAEDYAPFDVDVTTESPASSDVLVRTSSADQTYGTRVVITKSGVINCSCGGVAYVNVVSLVNNTAYQPAWVFYDAVGNSDKGIAEAAAHEAGHTLGLIHDGQTVNGTLNPYYAGYGSGATGWAPIMGVGYYKNVTQWDHGAYPGANNQQDDIAVIAASGFVARPDDVGDTIANATSLTNIATGATANVQNFGVIQSNTDIDMYSLTTVGGVVNLVVSPAVTGPNLDIKAALYKSDGTVLASYSDQSNLAVTINTTLAAGTYYLAVSNSVHAANGTDYGFTTYGSMGQYSVTGSYPYAGGTTTSGTNTQVPPTAVITASATTGQAPLPITFSANNSVGNGSITSYAWDFGDGVKSTIANVSHTYTVPGTYNVTLLVTNQYNLTNTQQMTIIVTAPPVLTIHESGYSIYGTISNNVLTVKPTILVFDNNNQPVSNVTVNATWSGALTGNVTGVTGANGQAPLTAVTSKTLRGASATLTITGMTAKGYTYNPTQNIKTTITITW